MKGQVLSPLEKQKRIVRARKLVKQVTVSKLNRAFFGDDKVFKVQDYRNSQNCCVYAPYNQERVKFQICGFILVEQDFPYLLWYQ